MFEVISSIEWCNIATSSSDIRKLKLPNEEATKRQINIRSIRNLAIETPIIMSYKNLKEEYEKRYSTMFSRFDKAKLTETKITHLIYIRTSSIGDRKIVCKAGKECANRQKGDKQLLRKPNERLDVRGQIK